MLHGQVVFSMASHMTFRSSHAVAGCSTVPQAGDYIDGYCENGVLQNGALFQDGVKVESFVR